MSAIHVEEFDEAGKLVKSYVHSASAKRDFSHDNHRVTVRLPPKRKQLWQAVLDAFLPAGFPGSVTDDYIGYQIYDSLQAFSSSIAGLLASRAVLEGVGVGDASTTPTAAVLLSIFKETSGRISTILFAHRFGTAIEPECKTYRLLADVLNDLAMIVDCLSPAFPRHFRVLAFSIASILRSMCGVAAGSAKASLSAHFATQGNLGELNAKDSSQETVISLCGMLFGTFFVQYITTPLATWIALLILLAIHLSTNYLAVRSVRLRTLNRQRAGLALSILHKHSYSKRSDIPVKAPIPAEIAQLESIFPVPPASLIWCYEPHHSNFPFSSIGKRHCGTASIGASYGRLLRTLPTTAPLTPDLKGSAKTPIELLHFIYSKEKYLLYYDLNYHATIVLKKGCTARDQLKAWWNALLLAESQPPRAFQYPSSTCGSDDSRPVLEKASVYGLMETTLKAVNKGWVEKERLLEDAGWDLDRGMLETRSGFRVEISNDPNGVAELKKDR